MEKNQTIELNELELTGPSGAAGNHDFDPLTIKLTRDILFDDYAGVINDDDSPYLEVRAAVPSSDDPSLPQNTIRMWVLGLLMTTIGSALNLYFSLHSPSFYVSTLVTSVLAWPLGRAWDMVIPDVELLGVRLNPSTFNVKEHALIMIMANASFSSGYAYAAGLLQALNHYYKKDFGWAFNLLAVLSTQCIGFSLAGLARRVLVTPSSMIWPSNLVSCTFLTNIHMNVNHSANGWTMSRLRFFCIAFSVSFLWYWFPGFLFQALSYFAFPTWIKPNSVVVNQLFGASTGLGLIPITFDWSQVAGYIGSPLIPPISAVATVLLSVVVLFWIITPAIHYSNVWYGKFLPMSDSTSYDRFQQKYNTSRIMNEDLSLNLQEYSNYSPLYLSTTFAFSYGLSLAATTAAIVHTALFHGQQIFHQLRFSQTEKPDVHHRLMKAYKECPDVWYICVFLVFFALSVVTIRVWNTEMPVYTLIVALLVAIVFLLPVGIIYALTNFAVGINVITEFIIGYMVPGKPIAMMFFKTFGYITNLQAITFAQDMKLGHYMKLQPRLQFSAQFAAAIWGSIVQVSVLKWAQGNITDLCSPRQSHHFTCPNAHVFFNSSVIWGVIGPERQFSKGKTYYGLLFFLLIGALLPIINWLILKKWPNSPVKYLNWPLFLSGVGLIPPATPYNYGSYCIVGIVFGYLIKRRFFHWWSKYNYSLSAALDVGLAWSSLVVFLSFSLSNTPAPSWWGNNVVSSTLDTKNNAIQVRLEKGDSFGPSSW